MNQRMEDNLPTVSVIVLNYNGKKYLDGCFESLARMSYPKNKCGVLMVDNCSTDGSVSYVTRHYPWVKVVQLNKNYGFCKGNNIGARFAEGEYVVFLNNDVVVDVDWLIELVKAVMKNSHVIATSKSFFLDKPDVINHDGSKATLIGRGFCVNFGRNDSGSESSSPRFVVQPYGASMLVKKDIFEKIGKFDEGYFVSLEDLDIGLRMWLLGYGVIYVPTSVFYHAMGATGGWGKTQSETVIYHSTKNSYMNILKCFDFSHTLQGIVLSLIYYSVMAIWFTGRTKRIRAAKLILLAHIWIIRNINSVINKRAELRKKRRIPYSSLFQPSFFASLSEMIREYLYIRSLG